MATRQLTQWLTTIEAISILVLRPLRHELYAVLIRKLGHLFEGLFAIWSDPEPLKRAPKRKLEQLFLSGHH
jgi:hypothetical protein